MPVKNAAARSPYRLEELTVIADRSPLGAAWRWRTEVALLLALAAWSGCLWWLLGWWGWPLILGEVLALALALVPWSRRFLIARFWCVLTRHRLQRAFWELRIHTRAGRLPLVPWLHATPVGCRAYVVLRAGMTLEKLDDNAVALAVACGAREAQVSGSGRWSSLIAIDVIRVTLAQARVVYSPLADMVPVLAAADPDGRD
jgi:hypothetical protein